MGLAQARPNKDYGITIAHACLRSRNLEVAHKRVSVRDWLKRSFDCQPAQMDAESE